MAMHRRPPGVEPPAELFEFRPEEWAAPGDLDRETAFQRWKAARRAWIAEHPGSALGDMLDLLQGERRARFGNLGRHQTDVSRLRRTDGPSRRPSGKNEGRAFRTEFLFATC